MFLPLCVCLSVSRITQKVADEYRQNFWKGRDVWQATAGQSYGADPHQDAQTGILKSNFNSFAGSGSFANFADN